LKKLISENGDIFMEHTDIKNTIINNDEEFPIESLQLLAHFIGYTKELSTEDKNFLQKKGLEIKIMYEKELKNEEEKSNEIDEIDIEDLEKGINFLIQFSSNSLPETFRIIDEKLIYELYDVIILIFEISYNSMREQVYPKFEGTLDDLEVSLNDFVNCDYLIKEMMSDLDASITLAILGFYKQALAMVRNILETTVLFSYIFIANKESRWNSGGFGIEQFKNMVTTISNENIIDDSTKNEILTVYWDYLCAATHSHKARMNAVRTDKHGFDLVRLHEYLGLLSWCGLCCFNLLYPLSSLKGKIEAL
jgi:hypothetical protein